MDKTVLKTIEEAAEDWKVNDIKALLGRCSFKAEMLHRKVAFLSGGEKVKLNQLHTDVTLLKLLDDGFIEFELCSKLSLILVCLVAGTFGTVQIHGDTLNLARVG